MFFLSLDYVSTSWCWETFPNGSGRKHGVSGNHSLTSRALWLLEWSSLLGEGPDIGCEECGFQSWGGWFKSWLHLWLAIWLWENYFTSLGLSFSICKVGRTRILATSEGRFRGFIHVRFRTVSAQYILVFAGANGDKQASAWGLLLGAFRKPALRERGLR